MIANLRELIAALQCEGMPQGSEWPVKVILEDGTVYDIVDIELEEPESFEGLPSGVGATTWIKVDPA